MANSMSTHKSHVTRRAAIMVAAAILALVLATGAMAHFGLWDWLISAHRDADTQQRGEIAQNRDKMLLYAGEWVNREKKLTILHLDNCPYCHKARRALDELCEENPAYRGVAVEWIEEERESEAASRYTDYYYVPTIYAGAQKLYEAHPGDSYETIKAEVKAALDAVV